MREARTEAVVVLALDVALFGGLPFVDQAQGWQIVDLPWWGWLVVATPALVLMILLLAVPLAELSPGRLRNAGVALLGLLVASDAVAVGVLLAALAGGSAGSLSAGDLLAHGTVVWLTNIITFGLLFWQLDEGGPRLRAERGRPDPDFEFPQDAAGDRLEPAAERLPLRVAHQRDRGQPDGHDAADPSRQRPHGRRVADLLCRGDSRRRPRRERLGRRLLTSASSRASSDLEEADTGVVRDRDVMVRPSRGRAGPSRVASLGDGRHGHDDAGLQGRAPHPSWRAGRA